MKKSLLYFLLVLFLAACGPTEPTVQETERIISVLASDEMRGRQAFSPEAWDAAAFISDEFKSAGLTPLAGDTDFIQDFPLYSVSTGGACQDSCRLIRFMQRYVLRRFSLVPG